MVSFDEIDHGWMLRFLEHRIADQRIIRLIRKWLEAGVIEDGKRVLNSYFAYNAGPTNLKLLRFATHSGQTKPVRLRTLDLSRLD